MYLWPGKVRCCGGLVTVEASTGPRQEAVFRRALSGDVDLYVAAGMPEPASVRLEVDRRGRLRAFWNGLAWVGSGRASVAHGLSVALIIVTIPPISVT